MTALQTDTSSGYFTSAYMDMESYFDLQSADDPKSPRLSAAPNSPPLNAEYRTSPIQWNGGRSSPRFHSFTTTSLSDLGVGSPQAGISLLQTTIAPENFIGNPSPPNSSESSPSKYTPPGDISPLDSLIVNMSEGSRTVHGQVTPPEDNMTSPNLEPLHNSLSLSTRLTPPSASPILLPRPASTRQQLSGSENATRESGRKRRSSTAQSGCKKQRKSVSVEEPLEVQEAKRKRFLERNRVAASKCRQKKKAWMQDLETEAREAQNMSKQLKLCVGMFKEEILQLKNELLKHNTCDCTPIRQYLSNEAIRLAEVGAGSLGMSKTARPSDANQYSFTADSEPKLDTSEFELDFIGN